jgi:GNAT superfamily N-acetyltransferase
MLPVNPQMQVNPNFVVLRATITDIEALITLQFRAMASEPYHHVVFPGGATTEALTDAAKRRLPDLLPPLSTSATDIVLKVIEANTYLVQSVGEEEKGNKEILGWAKWSIFPHPRPIAEYMHPTPSEILASINWVNPDIWIWHAAAEFLIKISTMRQRHVQGRPHIWLNPCMTDPLHQKRGVASELLRWGLETGRKLKLPCFLEATNAGRSLYEKWGFIALDSVVSTFLISIGAAVELLFADPRLFIEN